jgi:hypothetical protein
MLNKFSLTLVLFLVVMSTGIGIVSAETYSGTISRGAANYLINYTLPASPDNIGNKAPTYIHSQLSENTIGLRALIQYSPSASWPVVHDVGGQNAAQTAVIGTIGTNQIFTGTIGYQNVYSGGSFLYGYIYITTDNWMIGNRTGLQKINLTYDHNAV